MHRPTAVAPAAQTPGPSVRGLGWTLLARAGMVVSGGVAAVLGVAPHVLHHVGPLASAALFAGSGGTLLFAGLGFLAAVPMLLKMRRRTGSWRAPAAALALFAALFTFSTLVIGPAIVRDKDDQPAREVPARQPPAGPGHDEHHP